MKKIEPKLLEDSICGAFLPDTEMESMHNKKKTISELTGKDYLLTSEECHFFPKDIWKRKENTYYVITAKNGKTLKLTARQSILTKNGWKRAKNLEIGDQIMCYDFFDGRQFYALTAKEKIVGEELMVYSISLGDRTIIANGFICCDYDMQQGR